MQTWSDAQLLSEYAGRRSEAAFGEIVRRYANLVYSAAVRQTGGAEEARDVAQMVFADLARKAGSIGGNVVLAGWLYRGVQLQSLELRRNDQRRQWRERQAMKLADNPSEPERDWAALRPVLDDAMSNLAHEDRDALLLRFFKNESLASVGTALGVSEDAAQKRVSRALEKLREFLAHRGITTTAAALAATLLANTSESAPAGFAASCLSGALVGAKSATPHLFQLTTMKTTLLLMALAGGLAVVSVSHVRLQHERNALQSQLQKQTADLAALRAELDQLKSRPVAAADDETMRELARARAKLQRLQSDFDSEKSRRDLLAQRLASVGQPTNAEPPVPQVVVSSSFCTVPSSLIGFMHFGPNSANMASGGMVNAIMTASNAQAFKSVLLTNQDCNVLAAPRITTQSERQANVSVMDAVPFAGGTTNVGFSLDLFPHFSASSGPVKLEVGIQVSGLTPAGEFRVFSTNASFTVSDTDTVLMVIPAPAHWDSAPPFSTNSDELIVFITPTLVDPTGEPIHAAQTNMVPDTANPTGVFPGVVGATTPAASQADQ
jgi:RNA polymerase sigma factor (sigma-70 family)